MSMNEAVLVSEDVATVQNPMPLNEPETDPDLVLDDESIAKMKVKKLMVMMKERGMSIDGNNPVLIACLKKGIVNGVTIMTK